MDKPYNNFLLVGSNASMQPLFSANITSLGNIPAQTIDPQGMFRPPNAGSYTNAGVRTHSTVQLVSETSNELSALMGPDSYKHISLMSLDGLISPVSFYPTPNSTTFPITWYTRSKCPYCKGAGTINTTIKDPRLLVGLTITNSESITSRIVTPYTSPCKFCKPDIEKQKLYEKNTSSSEITPPYLIGSGTDLELINNRAAYLADKYNRVNRFTLNPIVMANGEFSCHESKDPLDTSVHSIDVIGFGMHAPSRGGNVRGLLTNQPNKNYGELDADFDNGKYQNNQRFFALKGPLMVHGWGYDLEGYPVPNASGEYKYGADGTPVLYNGQVLYKNQEIQPDGTVSPPYKEKTFYKGWASLPTTWPVGPVDLRWDNDAGVWTAGTRYKEVWLTIETAMHDSTPVRAVFEDDISDATPLPNGLRKVVFVKDSAGLFKAPRGAALYCKYNNKNGFYEPIYNQPFIAIGIIQNTTVANIQNTYTIKYSKNQIVEYYEGEVFDNPLSLPTLTGRKAIFTFIAGKWTLTSVG